MSVWTGRVDEAEGPRALRWHQMVKPLVAGSPPGIALIGFACDEGVRRNRGRVGAKDGPTAIRSALANFAWHQDRPVYDAGDVHCDNGDMEGAQSRLAEVVAAAIRVGHRPLVLGGGHETTWGTFQGIVVARPEATVGVINIDAHLDLRADEPGNSGTSFHQIARWCAANNRPFLYQPVGIAAASNTRALFDRAEELGVVWTPDYECHAGTRAYERVDPQGADAIHLSIDLDVLPASVMPAVSSPASGGIPLGAVEALTGVILDTGKVLAVDVVELNPAFDHDTRGARVAARLVYKVATEWES
jgi:formiminoglutamase